MDYKNILSELNEIVNSNLNMNKLNELSKLIKKANLIFLQEKTNGREDAKNRYIEVYNQIYEAIFCKLKECLEFDDDVLVQIIFLIIITKDIQDIYVLDGNVFGKQINNELSSETLFFVPNVSFININSKEFNDVENEPFKEKLLNSFNNLVKLSIKNNIDVSIKEDNNQINYELDDLNIYVNKKLSEIINDNTGKTFKVLIKYKDLLSYYDMKVRNESIITAENEYMIKKISEILDSKVKKLCKK